MKQHVTPLVINGKQGLRLERVSLQEKTYDEDWIQEICFENPTILPFYEIEPSCGARTARDWWASTSPGRN